MKLKIYSNASSQLVREWQNDLTIYEPTDEEMNTKRRWFLKVGESTESQSQTQSQGQDESQTQVDKSNLEFIELFIIDKLTFLKKMVDYQDGSVDDGPQLNLESDDSE